LILLAASAAHGRVIREAAIPHIRACVSQGNGQPAQGVVEFDTVDEAGAPVDHVVLPITSLLTDAERAQARGLLALALARLHQQYGIPTPSPTPPPTPTPTPTPEPTPSPEDTP
jgi:hypothetical protein